MPATERCYTLLDMHNKTWTHASEECHLAAVAHFGTGVLGEDGGVQLALLDNDDLMKKAVEIFNNPDTMEDGKPFVSKNCSNYISDKLIMLIS